MCFSLYLAAHEKASEIAVLLQYSESTFNLNGTVHTQQYSFFGSDTFSRFRLLLRHCFGEFDLAVFVLSLVTFFAMAAAFAAFAYVMAFH